MKREDIKTQGIAELMGSRERGQWKVLGRASGGSNRMVIFRDGLVRSCVTVCTAGSALGPVGSTRTS